MSAAKARLVGLGVPVTLFVFGGCAYSLGLDIGFVPPIVLELGGLILAMAGLSALRVRLEPSRLRSFIPWLLALVWLASIGEIVSYMLMAPLPLMNQWVDGPVEVGAFVVTFVLLAAYCDQSEAPRLARSWRTTATLWGVIYGGLYVVAGIMAIMRLSLTGGFGAMMILVIAIIVFTPPVHALVSAIRMKDAARHPSGRCPQCHYELAGLTGGVCPECARPFTRTEQQGPERAIVPWPRRLVMVQALSVAVLGVGAHFFRADSGMQSLKPSSLLIADATRQADFDSLAVFDRPEVWPVGHETRTWVPGAVEAQQEILDRINAGEVTKREARRLVDTVFSVQTDHDVSMGLWGSIFEALDDAGLVSDRQRAAFFTNSLVLELVPRRRVRADAVLPFEIVGTWRGTTARDGFYPDMNEAVQSTALTLTSITCNETSLSPLPPTSRLGSSGSDGIGTYGFEAFSVRTPEQMPRAPSEVGMATLEVVVRIDWEARGSFGTWLSEEDMVGRDLPQTWERTLTASVEIVPHDETTVIGVEDPTMADFISSSFKMTVYHTGELGFVSRRVGTRVEDLPQGIACDLMVQTTEGDFHIGHLFGHAGQDRLRHQPDYDRALQRRLRELELASFVVVPNPDLAERTVYVESMWIGDQAELQVSDW